MKKPYILWADDDEEDLDLVKEILQELNLSIEVMEVGNGKKALDCLYKAKLRDDLPCLIILDINMPVLGGKETLSLIKATEVFKEIPIVIFTTSNNELDKMYFRKFQVEMITKPPRYETLKKVIQQLIAFCN